MTVTMVESSPVLLDEAVMSEMPDDVKMLEVVLPVVLGALIVVVDPHGKDMIDAVLYAEL